MLEGIVTVEMRIVIYVSYQPEEMISAYGVYI